MVIGGPGAWAFVEEQTVRIRIEGSTHLALSQTRNRTRPTRLDFMTFFDPNISARGRLIRACGACVLVVAAGFLARDFRIAAVALALIAAFMFFEAARGWCVARACGIKTPF